MSALRSFWCLLALAPSVVWGQTKRPAPNEHPWYLAPVVRPAVPAVNSPTRNPIDAFVAAQFEGKGLKPAPRADRLELLRRVHLDLVGIPPTLAEQEAFSKDDSPDAYEKVVDRLLASEQHGVRYARHWLDVLRYADADDGLAAAPGIHLWREWVINALNDDLPYDQFASAQLTGYRSGVRTTVTALGFAERVQPRPEDQFALGFLARGAVVHGDVERQELPIAAVETASSAFLGLTVACAKCHDHEYDPIKLRDFYAMKALFDPLVLRKVHLAGPAETIAHGKKIQALDKQLAALHDKIARTIAPYKKKLHDERVAQLPADVQAVIRKPEKERTEAEEKIADDYFPILRIDVSKILLIMPEAEKGPYKALVEEYRKLEQAKSSTTLPVFWTVEVDRKKEMDKTYVLTSGDPMRPQKNKDVGPGWPFAPKTIDWRKGRIDAFADWLVAPENPLFARVGVNRLWQWHFGVGLQKNSSDFGKLGGTPTHPALLDWLAAEFAARKFSMKEMHRLIVTSETYQRASRDAGAEANLKIDPTNAFLWRFPLRRLDAETVWDSIFRAADALDLKIGGTSFLPADIKADGKAPIARRGAYLTRGYAHDRDVTPAFLLTFDVDDGRTPCPMRTQTVTAPQTLFLMNSAPVQIAAERFASRLKQESGGDLKDAVERGYRIALGRRPSAAERSRALDYIEGDPTRLQGFAWLLFNLDEFVFVR